MLMFSSRRDFWNNNEPADEYAAAEVTITDRPPPDPVVDPDEIGHIDPPPFRPTTQPVADPIGDLAASTDRRLLMLIHGFNNAPEDVISANYSFNSIS